MWPRPVYSRKRWPNSCRPNSCGCCNSCHSFRLLSISTRRDENSREKSLTVFLCLFCLHFSIGPCFIYNRKLFPLAFIWFWGIVVFFVVCAVVCGIVPRTNNHSLTGGKSLRKCISQFLSLHVNRRILWSSKTLIDRFWGLWNCESFSRVCLWNAAPPQLVWISSSRCFLFFSAFFLPKLFFSHQTTFRSLGLNFTRLGSTRELKLERGVWVRAANVIKTQTKKEVRLDQDMKKIVFEAENFVFFLPLALKVLPRYLPTQLFQALEPFYISEAHINRENMFCVTPKVL